jgi:geranylgeranyl reductase family protein
MVNTDVAIVGGGPAGLIAAREAAKRGAKVTVFEKQKEIGLSRHCAGLLSVKGLKTIDVPLKSIFIKNRFRGARFHSPSGITFTVEREEDVACFVDRSALDKFLAKQASDVGADIRLLSKVLSIKSSGKQMLVSGHWGQISANAVVNAEGVASKFVKAIGLTPINPAYILPALQFDLTDVDVDTSYVDIYLGRKLAPGFFVWVIPINNNSVRVGMACKKIDLQERLTNFVQDRFAKFTMLSARTGFVITCGPIRRTFDEKFIVVGDAAGQVKPTTGGGVIMGGICSSIAGEVVANAVKTRKTNLSFLRIYEELWKKKVGKELNTMFMARRIANRLTDKAMDNIFKAVLEKNLQTEFLVNGDMDFQSKVISSIAKKKVIIKILLSIVPDIIRSKKTSRR